MKITYKNVLATNFFTQGFEVTYLKPFSIAVASGAFHILDNETVLEFPEFNFDIVPDADLDVIYDVYLLETTTETPIHIDRTEMMDFLSPSYEEETPLLHTLFSIRIPAGITSLDNMELVVNTVVKKDED